ncbi:MAG: bifunctional NADH-specific enoyl-ACP reductase/trans-2-enoyl-CoA reductase [Jatrophihabitans sp.]
MIVEPFFRGALSATAHPAGCRAQVRAWIDRLANLTPGRPVRALVIGSSGGVGLAARIVTAFGAGSPSIGVALERPGVANRPGTAGWYRCVAFEDAAAEAGLSSRTVIGDAFADTVKARVAELVAAELGQLDLLLYSVAAPRRHNPRTGCDHRSVIKSLGQPFSERGYDLGSAQVLPMSMPVASPAELADTVAVMGGEDLAWWVELLRDRRLLATGFSCVALSYVGVPRLAASYRAGTLGAAKDHLERTVRELDAQLRQHLDGSAEVAVLRALVTQSSAVIPMNTLYTMLLMRVLAERAAGEDVLDQAVRLLDTGAAAVPTGRDSRNRRRLDDREQRADVQDELWRRWSRASTETVDELAAVADYRGELHALYGFGVAGVDYAADVDPVCHSDRLVLA